jgi:biotin carboxylase
MLAKLNSQTSRKNQLMKRILLINPFASPGYLSASLKQLGIKTTALYTYSYDTMLDYIKPEKSWFDEQIFSENPEEAIKTISHVDYVLNGIEWTVPIGDQIASTLAPAFANDSATSRLRMDKRLMHETLAQHGLNHIKQVEIKIDEIFSLAPSFPCFVKPKYGAGTLGAARIDSLKNFQQFFKDLNQEEIKAITKEEVLTYLICDYIEGEEYFIDTFSCKGEHYISSVHKYYKDRTGNAPMYQYDEVEKSPEMLEIIIPYVKKVLTTLGLHHGFAHTELFVRKDNSPVLIELNPRISGAHGMGNHETHLAGFPTQPELLANIIFDEPLAVKKPHSTRLLFLYNFKNAPLPDLHHRLESYQSIDKVEQLVKTGYVAGKMPSSLLDTVAFVACQHDNPALLNQEVNEILLLDKNGW